MGETDVSDIRAVSPLPEGHPEVLPPKVGVLLLNLGTPDATDYWSMRRYLGEFLSDRRIIELSPLLWQPILQGIILMLRPSKSGRAYEAIWDRERNESPLRTITRAQAEKLAAMLEAAHPEVVVDWAMRYGNPSTEAGLRGLLDRGCSRILLFPLYPQYSAATTATACDQAFRTLMKLRWQPAVRTAPAYHDDPAYIATLAGSVRDHLAQLEWSPEVVLASFHGLPQENLDKGDPYHCHCQKTARLLCEALGWEPGRLQATFESRFGPKEWLQPYSDDTVRRLAEQGTKSLAVVAPGFAGDCVETLEEVAIGLKETFEEHGGENFTYIPCLNDASSHIEMLAGLVRRELSGWITGEGN